MREPSPAAIYADEVAYHLWDMKVGEERVIAIPPNSNGQPGLAGMLECRGWFRARHYLTRLQYPHEIPEGQPQRRILEKTGEPAVKKLKPVDEV